MNGSCHPTFAESNNNSNKNGKHSKTIIKYRHDSLSIILRFHFIYSQHKKSFFFWLLILTFFPISLSTHTQNHYLMHLVFYIFINMQTNPKHVVCIISLFIENFFINILNKSFLLRFVNEMNFFNGIVTFIHSSYSSSGN